MTDQYTVSLEEPLNTVLRATEEHHKADSQLAVLQATVTALYAYDVNISNAEEKLQVLPLINGILQDHSDRTEVVNDIEDLKEHVKEMSMLAINTKTAQIELSNKGLKFHENMPEECPLCGK